MRSIRHPGPSSAQRSSVAPCGVQALRLELKAGDSMNHAVTHAFANAGFSSGYVDLQHVRLASLRYVIPAPAPDETHAAWYSETFAPQGAATIEAAGLIAGMRDGEPFVHCHGIWQLTDGTRHGGHLLPHDSILAENATVVAWGVAGAAFVASDDAETNFKLFSAQPGAPGSLTAVLPRAVACTIRPNADIANAIEDICNRHGFAAAQVSGVGSLVGVDFTDGRHVASYATEVFITDGRVLPKDGTAHCVLDVALVDLDGNLHHGTLARGQNPVCVTFELMIREVADNSHR
jgi:predicted DNA-binding protein with PD1-like motif